MTTEFWVGLAITLPALFVVLGQYQIQKDRDALRRNRKRVPTLCVVNDRGNKVITFREV